MWACLGDPSRGDYKGCLGALKDVPISCVVHDHRARESHGLTRSPWSPILPEEVQDTVIARFRSRVILEDTHGRPPLVVPL